MTGIDRLRAIAGAWDEWGLGGALTEIADEIERERAEDCYRMGLDCGTVWRVVADMERHCLGHEGVEDSPVARWARELREALKCDMSDVGEGEKPSCATATDAADVTSEAQKVTREDAEAIAWVRDHGGLDHVRAEWNEHVPRDRYVRRRQRLLRHIAECETALGRRNRRIEELGHRVSDMTSENTELRKRAMPEGMEWLIEAWPKFEDDAPVKLGDMALIDGDVDMVEAVQIWIHGKPVIYGDNGSQQLEKEERVKLPFLAADGEPLEVGQTVWDANGDELVIGALEDGGRTVTCRYADVGDGIPTHGMWSPSDLTHQRPVLDADGVPIHEGDTVYEVGEKYPPFIVGRLPEPGAYRSVKVVYPSGAFTYLDPERLTHAKPEIDTWQRIEEDVMVDAKDYCESRGISSEYPKHSGKAKCEDLVRRCRALAERERSE